MNDMRARRSFMLSLFATVLGGTLPAATYLPLSDADLARRSPVIARAQVSSRVARLEEVNGKKMPVTLVTFERLDTLRGHLPNETFRVWLPGGQVGGFASWVPGTPSFEEGEEVLLFLRPAPGHQGDFCLSEFGLSRFDIRVDAEGRRFALRPAFPPEEDDYLSMRAATIAPVGVATARPFRNADSFERALRTIAGNGKVPRIEYAQPRGALTDGRGRIRPLWVNLGGREPGDCGGQPCLFRWFWDTGKSPDGVVTIVGTQSNLSDSSDGSPHVQNAVTQWHGVAASDVRYSMASASSVRASGILASTVSVQLDAPASFDMGMTFNTPLSCSSGGVLGLGGTQNATGPSGGYTFKGDANYFAMQSGIVTMRKLTGPAGCYDFTTFRTSVMHELGHTLGLGHPDQGQSTHSTTTPADWAVAVMVSSVPPAHPSTPQIDDIQAIQFYYGTGVTSPTPTPTSGTPTPTPTGVPAGSARGHVTPIFPPTPKSNISGRQ